MDPASQAWPATKWPSICGLVLGTFFLTRHVPTTFAFDRPLLSSSVVLISITIAVIGIGRVLPKEDDRTVEGAQYDALPLNEPRGDSHVSHEQRPRSPITEDVTYASSPRKLRILIALLGSAIVLRVILFLYILQHTQCATISWEPLLPFAFAFLDYLSIRRAQKRPAQDSGGQSAFDTFPHYVVRSQHNSLVAVCLFSVASVVSVAVTRGPPSTYICAASQREHWLTPFFQRIGVILDTFVIYIFAQLLQDSGGQSAQSDRGRIAFLGSALLRVTQFSAACLIASLIPYYIRFATPAEKHRLFKIPSAYIWSLLKLNVSLCLTVVSALLAILHMGLTTVSVLTTFVTICTLMTSHALRSTFTFPPIHNGFWTFGMSILGLVLYIHIESFRHKTYSTGKAPFKKIPILFYMILLAILLVQIALRPSQNHGIINHPIDTLIQHAKDHHEANAQQAASSRNLADAVEHYRQRYNRHPPPGFDQWYKYATEREAVIIDDFDTIHRDLLPFFALSPQDIRQRTWDTVSNKWQDANGLLIRNGRVAISDNVLPTHRWMLEGVANMISKFSQHIPDMDLAFNANDESRIVVPFAEIDAMRQSANGPPRVVVKKPDNAFSAGRASQWKPIPKKSNPDRVMTEHSWQHTFYDFGAIACPPSSPARKERRWDVSQFCTSCAEPHSMGPFLANWTNAGDICHQPDLASLHGFYLSPAAFKVSTNLYPIFSQSKAYGFNDILYPSAWNYMDKIKYNPSDEYPDVAYTEKNHSLFWRGATSEGVSSGNGQWEGMSRQRFMHMSNDINGIGTQQSVLLPSTQKDLAYTPVAYSDLAKMVPTDINFIEITRCGREDCPIQHAEFSPFAQASNFQGHWKHKYLLDLDGAGFSGRFIPFMLSHSLVFKAALFREWWDDRLTAWYHFVPLDLRGHGFWATLAYFTGMEGRANGRRVKLDAHEPQGERIAENGREWANKVLRKEDMEIYMFRLLLEWGRLTDDRRDRLGFSIDNG